VLIVLLTGPALHKDVVNVNDNELANTFPSKHLFMTALKSGRGIGKSHAKDTPLIVSQRSAESSLLHIFRETRIW
jgi:hypothetical protein